VVSRKGKKNCNLGVFPVSIKHEEFLELANSEKVKERVAEIRKKVIFFFQLYKFNLNTNLL
jgi:trehalose-6-phosphate synthase